MAKFIELRLRAVGPNHVSNPFRLGWIGKVYSAETEDWSLSGVEEIRADALTVHQHGKYLRDAIAEGEIACEDAATAAALGLAFSPPKAPPASKPKES